MQIIEDPIDLYDSLSEKAKILTSNFKKKIIKTLIVSSNSKVVYSKFNEEFPDSNLFLVNSFDSNLNDQFEMNDLNTYNLDIFNGSALTDFLMRFGKFDLIVLVFDTKKSAFKKKRLVNSILFFFKHFLNKAGVLILGFNFRELYNKLLGMISKSKIKNNILTYQANQAIPPYNLIALKKS